MQKPVSKSLWALAIALTECGCSGRNEWRFQWSTPPDFPASSQCIGAWVDDPLDGSAYHRRVGPNRFHVEVNLEGCEAEQQDVDFCWAAAIETVLRYMGVETTQPELVTYIRGNFDSFEETHDATRGEIALAMERTLAAAAPVPITVTTLDVDTRTLVSDLGAGRPLIVGFRVSDAMGHVCVLKALDYCYTLQDDGLVPSIIEAQVFDPDAHSSGRLHLVQEGYFRDKFDFATRFSLQYL